MCIAFVAQHSQKMFRCEPHDENNGSRLGLPISTIVRLAFFFLYSGSHFGNWVLIDTRASEACGTAIRRAQCTCKFGTFCTLYLPDGNFTQNTKDGGVRMREKERKREEDTRVAAGKKKNMKPEQCGSVCAFLFCVSTKRTERCYYRQFVLGRSQNDSFLAHTNFLFVPRSATAKATIRVYLINKPSWWATCMSSMLHLNTDCNFYAYSKLPTHEKPVDA